MVAQRAEKYAHDLENKAAAWYDTLEKDKKRAVKAYCDQKDQPKEG
jgi:hypothetical protein